MDEPTAVKHRKHRHRRRVHGTYEEVRSALQSVIPRIGQIDPSDLREALKKLGIKVNIEDLEKLSNEVGARYDQPANTNSEGKHLPDISFKGNNNRIQNLSYKINQPKTSLGDNVKSKLQAPILKHWRSIQKHCKDLDPTGSSYLEMESFLLVLAGFGIRLQAAEADWIYLKFGQRASGRINYTVLLTSLVTSGFDERRRDGASSAPPFLPSVPPRRHRADAASAGGRAQEWEGVGEGVLRGVAACWRPLLTTCRALDVEGRKLLPREQVTIP